MSSHARLDRRLFCTFLSHAHANKEVVDRLYYWMSGIAEIPVWYDSYNLPPTAKVATMLAKAISQCQGMMVVLFSRDRDGTEAEFALPGGFRAGCEATCIFYGFCHTYFRS